MLVTLSIKLIIYLCGERHCESKFSSPARTRSARSGDERTNQEATKPPLKTAVGHKNQQELPVWFMYVPLKHRCGCIEPLTQKLPTGQTSPVTPSSGLLVSALPVQK